MHVLTVCYGHPTDPAAFDAYYTSTHAPLAEKTPGMTPVVHSRRSESCEKEREEPGQEPQAEVGA